MTLASIVAAAAPGVARADNPSQKVQATVVGASNPTSAATVAQLEASCPVYGLPSYDPDGTPFPAGATWSVRTLLGCLQPAIVVGTKTSVIVGSDELTPADFATPNDFVDQTESPVVFSDGSNLRYERPARPGGAVYTDVVPDPQPLALTVFTGPSLSVTITPSATSVPAGGPVSFTAAVSGGAASDYEWTFGGAAPDSSATDPSVSAFAAGESAGTYTVSVTATDPATGAAGVASLNVAVTGATAPAATTTSATTTTPPQSTTATTPASGGTGRHGSRGGHGPGSGTTPSPSSTTPTRSPPRRSRTRPTHPASTATRTTTSPAPHASPASPAATATTPPPARRPPVAHHPRHASAHAQQPHPPRRRAPVPRRTPPTAGATTFVSGQLLADVTPVPAGESPLTHPVAPSRSTSGGAAASIAHASPLTWPQRAGALAVLAALLGLGAARELRSRRAR